MLEEGLVRPPQPTYKHRLLIHGLRDIRHRCGPKASSWAKACDDKARMQDCKSLGSLCPQQPITFSHHLQALQWGTVEQWGLCHPAVPLPADLN